MSFIPKIKTQVNSVLLLHHLHDQFLSLVLDKLRPEDGISMSLCLSSCRQGEGVSTMAYNMAMALSENLDKRVLLVDANSRRPGLGKMFHIDKKAFGLMDVLQEKVEFEEVLKMGGDDYPLSFIAAGKKATHPIVHFSGNQFDSFLEEGRKHFDIIIFDAPALTLAPETSVLARKLDGFIMVVEAEKTRWEVARYYKEQLADSGVCFTGAILNKKKMFIPRLIYRLLLAE